MTTSPDNNLKTDLASLVNEHGLDAVLKALGQVCKQTGHSLRFDKNEYAEADRWYQAGVQLADLAVRVPGKTAQTGAPTRKTE